MELELTTRRRPRGQSGFSLVEALLAAALFLILVVGILPLFTQATIQNVAGREATAVANVARARAEEMLQMPFNSPALAPQAGLVDYLEYGQEIWSPTPPTGNVVWTRTTTVRQYNVSALDDGVLTPAEALPGGSDPGQIHLKEIVVQVQSGRPAGALGASQRVTVRVLKSK